MINKTLLRQQLLELLNTQRQIAFDAASSAHDLATHEQSKAETQYDTVGLEAAYLAHGQSQRVADCDAMIARIKALVLREFEEDDEIAVGAVITLDDDSMYWLLPDCGGTKLNEGKLVVVTPHSPLGEQLKGEGIDSCLKDGRTIVHVE
ncbi:hypothetical protein [Vibrio nitrifigilis]|uniref:Transcription elongation factor n=1 Tax=Vibrio nitrifigilis TaxID=2789781 RepID=A0ABS0GD47_9VIBR|nr:hypothetical protein [Vibrio nitrifigilis]MBF9000347.1 hypothetical protein [Vibrio nitrifigilis]